MKNECFETVITGYGMDGEGVSRSQGKVVFIPYALKGETVKAVIVKEKQSFSYAKLAEIINPSQKRAQPVCPLFKKCGGCDIMHMSYGEQLAFKTELVGGALKKAGLDVSVFDAVPSDLTLNYRNKISLPVRNQGGKTVVGFYKKRSHEVVEISDCPLQPKEFAVAVMAFKTFIEENEFRGYGEDGGGDIRQLIIRRLEGHSYITVVFNKKERNLGGFCDCLSKAGYQNFSVYANIAYKDNNVIIGEKWGKAYGESPSRLFGFNFDVHPGGFFQVNDGIRQKIYGEALKEVGRGVLVDAYSGAGLMGAEASKFAEKVYSIEVNPQASDSARLLKSKNALGNFYPTEGKAEDKLGGILEDEKGKDITVVLDPPRGGCDIGTLKALLKYKPEKVVYISCNPATLARDLKILSEEYNIIKAVPYDMFPQTAEVETLVLLSHKEPDSHINVTVEFGEREGQISLEEIEKRAEARKPKEKVTYKMMQQYIEENYGFKVHTAYIAEVKRSLGLPMYDAPNAVEELKHPRPHPTERMVAAIKETLAHFDFN